MGNLLELGDHELHCCMKVVVQNDAGADCVGTIGRSDPYDNRPNMLAPSDLHLVEKNSVWCSLLGRDDGSARWPVFSCFACNDLYAHPADFKCDRTDWQKFYRSTLVFPLRYIQDEVNSKFVTFGFLAFDSVKKGVFGDVPDIFHYRERWHAYHERLSNTTAFHVGAVFADTLSVLMRRYFEKPKKDGASNETN